MRSADWRTDHVVIVATGKSAIEIELPEDTGSLVSLTSASFDITKELKSTVFAFQRKPTLASAGAADPRLDPMGNPIDDDDEDVSSTDLALLRVFVLHFDSPVICAVLSSQSEEEEESAEVLAALYKRTGLIDETFFLSLSDPDKGKLYECKHGNDYALNELPSHAEECGTLRYSSSGKFLLSGCTDGTAHVRAAANPDYFVCVHLHDGHQGEVTSLCSSFDDEFLLTGDASGCIFVSRLRPIEIEAHAAEATTNKSAMVKGAQGIVMSVEKVSFLATLHISERSSYYR